MKKSKIKEQINDFIDTVLNVAEREGKLDYFELEINNHAGNLQMDFKVRDRKKAY